MTTQLAPIVGPQGSNSVLTISKARIKKGLLYCEFTEQHDLQTPARAFTMQGTQPVHDDLTAAVAALVPHFISLTEQLPATHTEDNLEQFTVAGFSISNKNGITLNGSRTLKNGSTLTLTAPFVSFDEEQFEEYDGAPQLEEAAAAVLAEVELALRGKCSDAGKQLDMFQGTPAELKEEVLRESGGVTEAATQKCRAGRVTE